MGAIGMFLGLRAKAAVIVGLDDGVFYCLGAKGRAGPCLEPAGPWEVVSGTFRGANRARHGFDPHSLTWFPSPATLHAPTTRRSPKGGLCPPLLARLAQIRCCVAVLLMVESQARRVSTLEGVRAGSIVEVAILDMFNSLQHVQGGDAAARIFAEVLHGVADYG